jgi:hypothetical protein
MSDEWLGDWCRSSPGRYNHRLAPPYPQFHHNELWNFFTCLEDGFYVVSDRWRSWEHRNTARSACSHHAGQLLTNGTARSPAADAELI